MWDFISHLKYPYSCFSSHCFIIIIIIIIIIINFLMSFSHHLWLVVFHKRLSDSKSPQVFRTLLSILDDLNRVAFWMVLIFFWSPISLVSFPPLWGLFQATTFGITITLMFHSFFSSQAKSKCLLFCFLLFFFVNHWNSKLPFFLLINNSSGLIF